MQAQTQVLTDLSYEDWKRLEQITTPKMTKYIPHTPNIKQTAFLLLDSHECFYGGAAGGGKMLPLDVPILTDTGWKTVGTLAETDHILALDGTWTTIEYITPIQQHAINYKITFSCDNSIICNSEHLWTVEECVVKSHQRKKTTAWVPKVLSTQEILNRGLYMKKNNKWQKAFRLPEFRGFEGVEQELPIHPYFLGYWLGDGSSTQARFTVGVQDIDSFFEAADRFHLDISDSYQTHGNCYDLRCKPLIESLRQLQLLNNKHIPQMYKLASREQRLWLLRGLMDSDGHVQERGRCEWGQKKERKRLFDDVCELLCGLGNKISITEAPSSLNNVSFPSWRVTFTPFEEVFYFKRKNLRLYGILHQDPIKQRANLASYIESIKQVEADIPMKCIRIKHPSHTFIVGKRFIPTHNSEALLMAALQYVDVPGYSALLLRRTFQDLSLPGALMDRARDWLAPYVLAKEVRWVNTEKTYQFPSGATLTFGYLEHEGDKYRYQSAEFQYIGFDELTQFTETQYRYMFSRLRKLRGLQHSQIPLRMRSASNPDGDGLRWVRQRFIIEGAAKGRIFIPAKLEDNPALNQEEYEESLSMLDPITRERLRHGNWDIREEGKLFKREWFSTIRSDELPGYMRLVRYWDFASSEPKRGTDPDYTVGLLLGEHRGIYYLLDIKRFRKSPEATEVIVRRTAKEDGFQTIIFAEEEPGSSGKMVIDHYARNVLKGYAFKGNRETGSKILRANPVSSAAERGNIFLVQGYRSRGLWINDFLDEVELFPTKGVHDDQVDALSGALRMLKTKVHEHEIPFGIGERESYWGAM